ncbi:MAG: toxin-antitoxin system protein [Candidatus Omnitrophica bacterium]|nr:toxin-antitoxin system protein [Candidatus Omnitrophota bacterium]
MISTTIRIEPKAHKMLRRIAKQSGKSMQSSLTKAIELYYRRDFLQKTNAAFDALRKDPKGWQEELKEREGWDATLLDDIKDS